MLKSLKHIKWFYASTQIKLNNLICTILSLLWWQRLNNPVLLWALIACHLAFVRRGTASLNSNIRHWSLPLQYLWDSGIILKYQASARCRLCRTVKEPKQQRVTGRFWISALELYTACMCNIVYMFNVLWKVLETSRIAGQWAVPGLGTYDFLIFFSLIGRGPRE